MSVAPHEILACAQQIRGQELTEAGNRTVVSRAYYAAYHAAYNFHVSLPSPGSVGSANGRHEQLIAQLTTPTFGTSDARNFASRKAGHLLRDLLRRRVKADYAIGATVPEADADAALFTASDIFRICFP